MSENRSIGQIRRSLAVVAACVVIITAAVLIALLLPRGEDGFSHLVIDGDGVKDGEYDISLVRERLESRTLDSRGFAVDGADDTLVDFSISGSANIFGMGKDVLVGPRCGFTAYMAISNNAPYPFTYRLEIVPTGGQTLLADQLELTVLHGGETYIKRSLSDGLVTKPLPTAGVGEISRFIVKLEYLDGTNNNATQNSTLTFDMIVHVGAE